MTVVPHAWKDTDSIMRWWIIGLYSLVINLWN